MTREATQTKKVRQVIQTAPGNRAEAAIRGLVRLLARQAADKDYEAFVKAHQAANDND